LSVSLVARGDLLGVLCLGSDEQDAFSAEDRMIVEEVADLLAIAVHQAQLFQDLIISRTQLRLLARQAVSAREAERQRIATILHNDTGQTLAVLAINLSLIERNLPDDCPQVMLRVARAGAMVEEIAAQTRALARSLRPPSLDHVGLHATLQAYCQELAAETQLAIEYRGTPDLPDLSPAAQICLYRCLQEALTNVLKHAGASQVQAELSIRPAQGQVCLAVQDNGRGFRAADELLTGGIWTQGSGLLALREWLDSLNGELRVSSQPGQGCLLEALVPVTTGVLP
jgi:signal transduction histidine kinase